jgi:RNA polymerase sigma-70 factor (ECF subfamily)
MPESAELLSELVDRCRRGERRAAERLVQRFHGYVLTLARALVSDGHRAEDLAQESMLIMLTRLGDVREPRTFAGWLRQIVRNQVNRLARDRATVEMAAEPVDVRPSPLDRVQLDELRALVRAAIAGLPPAGQQTARLFYLDELDQSQIATRLDVPLGTVKRRLHDARSKLRYLLREQRPGDRGLPL